MLVVLGLLVAGLMGLLAVNTAVAQDAFVLGDLQQTSAKLADREEMLLQQVALAQAPDRLAARARRLGMVPATNPTFVRLHDSAVLGVPSPASAAGTKP